jgi:hypothetical protein
MSISMFCMYKDLSEYKWINTNENKKLNPEDYIVCINPQVLDVSKMHHYEYETCGSFK